MTYTFLSPAVVHLPATTRTPDVEIHAAKVLAAMQRNDDTMLIPLREIRANRVRSTWSTRDNVLNALRNLVDCGLVEQGAEIGRDGISRPRYKLTPTGLTAKIHITRLAKVRKRANPTFDEALAAAQAVCPVGYTLCMVPTHSVTVANPAAAPTPTVESPF